MQSRDSVRITERFFLALDTLKNDRVIRGVATFTRKYGINRRNLYILRHEMERDIFQAAWLAYLVTDYGVSADWLLTGAGPFYRSTAKKTAKKPQVTKSGSGEEDDKALI